MVTQPCVKSRSPLQIRRYRALHPGQLSPGQSKSPDLITLRWSSQGHPPQFRRYRSPSPWSTLHQVKSRFRPLTRSTLRQVKLKMHLCTWSTLCMSSRGHPRNPGGMSPPTLVKLSARSSRGLVLTPDQHSIGQVEDASFAHGQLSAVSSRVSSLTIRKVSSPPPWSTLRRSSQGCALAPVQHSIRPSRGHILSFVLVCQSLFSLVYHLLSPLTLSMSVLSQLLTGRLR